VSSLLLAYARERVRLEVFAPAIALLSFAALWVAGADNPNLTVAGGALALMTLLILQFRLWDDLADRDRDRAAHPHRVLVAHDPAPFRGLLIVLGAAAGAVGFVIGGTGALVSIAILDGRVFLLYRAIRPRLTADVWPALLVAAKYPALVALVATIVGEPVWNRLLLGCLTTSAGACLYEWTHTRPSSAGVTP
jgi:4-hydroxybenzoate polyprenyltransferase